MAARGGAGAASTTGEGGGSPRSAWSTCSVVTSSDGGGSPSAAVTAAIVLGPCVQCGVFVGLRAAVLWWLRPTRDVVAREPGCEQIPVSSMAPTTILGTGAAAADPSYPLLRGLCA